MNDYTITPDLLLNAYAAGIFPMAENRDDDEIFWVDPEERGILPLDSFHAPRSLKKLVKRDVFDVTIDRVFPEVVSACAAPAPGREGTWINPEIETLYADLHRRGFAHSVECWQGEELVGGLYGVSIGSAFFGESMFHRATGASKVALVHLVARLRAGGFSLLDTQFTTEHLAQFGVVAISRDDYQRHLEDALMIPGADFYKLPVGSCGSTILQLITQTS